MIKQVTTSVEQLASITIDISNRLSLRLYGDCRPNCLETGPLQKGLVLLLNRHELIEEGVGFGVPVVKYRDKTFFPSKAHVSIQRNGFESILTKAFILDTVSIKKFGNASYIDDAVYSRLRKTFQLLYLRHRKLYPLFNKLMEIRDLLQVKTEFLTVESRGTIVVTYRCQPEGIRIHADFSKIAQNGCEEVLLLNEQGSSFFQKYSDGSGNILVGKDIGAWDRVEASEASLSGGEQLKFSLKKVEGAQLFRGYERTRKRFSWAGLSYAIPPRRRAFEYYVALFCGGNSRGNAKKCE